MNVPQIPVEAMSSRDKTKLHGNLPQQQSALELAARIQKSLVDQSIPRSWQHEFESRPSLVVLDRGCGNGENSFIVLKTLEGVFRKHIDLPIHFFANDRDDPKVSKNSEDLTQTRDGSSSDRDYKVYTSITHGSFIDQLAPSGSVDLVFSNMALHWLDFDHPTTGPNCLSGMPHADAVTRIAAHQWRTTLLSISKELRPGGKFFAAFVVKPPSGRHHIPLKLLCNAINRIVQPQFDSRFSFTSAVPVYLRTRQEVVAPFIEVSKATKLSLESYEIRKILCPFSATFMRTGDSWSFADCFTDHIKAFSESALLRWALKSGFAPSLSSKIVGKIFSEVHSQISNAPENCHEHKYFGFLSATKTN